MEPDPTARYALLASGASFSCSVLEALVRCQHPPALLVLPEYPPATRARKELVAGNSSRKFLQIDKTLEIAYAPAARQSEMARTVGRRGLQFLLIACWPYLLAPELIESPACATLNLHPSLLPAWRGADPLRQQIAAGDSRFGVSLHLLDQRFDHGDIVAQAALTGLENSCDLEVIEAECAQRGVDLFLRAMAEFPHWYPVTQTD